MECCSDVRREKIVTHTATWMNLAGMMLRQKSLSLKTNTAVCLEHFEQPNITHRKWDGGTWEEGMGHSVVQRRMVVMFTQPCEGINAMEGHDLHRSWW